MADPQPRWQLTRPLRDQRGGPSANGRRWTRRRLLRVALRTATLAALPALTIGAPLALAAEPIGQIALPRGREAALIRADGSDERTIVRLAPGGYLLDLALSTDGTKLALGIFTAPVGGAGGSDIAVAPLDPVAGPPSILVPRDRPGVQLGAPCWAPDGSGLVFESVANTPTGAPMNSVEWVAADGTGRRTIAAGARFPAIAPDGREVVYVRNAPTGDGLYAQPLGGGPERRLIPDDRFMAITYPRFSPDGSTVAFAGVEIIPVGAPKLALTARPGESDRFRAPSRHGMLADPYLVSSTGADPRRAALLAFDDLAVAWSPDGAWLAAGGLLGLVLVQIEDGSARQLSPTSSFGSIDWR